MIVEMPKRGSGVTGRRLGSSNVLRHFPGNGRTVELQMDHLENARAGAGQALRQVVVFPTGERPFSLRLDPLQANNDDSPLPPAAAA